MSSFLPKWTAMPARGQYMGCYKIMTGDCWRRVIEDGETVLFPTYGEALRAAEKRVEAILNPKIRSEKPRSPRPDLIMKQRESRLKQQAQAQREAFGVVIVRGNAVKVETKR